MSSMKGTLIWFAAFLFVVGCGENTLTGEELPDDDVAPINDEIEGGDADADTDADADSDADGDADDDTGEFVEVDTYSAVDWEQIANDWRLDEPDLE